MKKVIKVKDFTRVNMLINNLDKVINRQNKSDILKLLKIDVRLNTLSITAIDPERSSTLNFPCEYINGAFSTTAFIYFDDFKFYAKKLTGDAEILFSTENEKDTFCDFIIITTSKSSIKFRCTKMEPTEFPSMDGMFPVKSSTTCTTRIHLTERRDSYIDLFDKLSISMCKDYVRPAYCGIHLVNKDNRLWMDSTDGKRMMLVEVGLDFNDSRNLVIPDKIIDYILSIKKYLKESEIRIYGYSEKVNRENYDGNGNSKLDLVVKFGRIEIEIYDKQEIHVFAWPDVGMSPDPFMVLPTDEDAYTTSIREVSEIQIKNLIDGIVTKDPHTLIFDFTNKTIHHANAAVDISINMIDQIPIKDFTGNLANIHFNKQFILDAMTQVGIGQMKFKNNAAPMYIKSTLNGKDVYVMVMPVRPQYNQ